MESVECEVCNVKHEVSSVECGVWSVKCKAWRVEMCRDLKRLENDMKDVKGM